MLGATGLNDRARLIVEKPFGHDLASARALNQTLHAVLEESQIFRIDHFRGKEAVQNILAFRFADGLFEPVWNRRHVDYVQIDVPEQLTIEGRAGFFEQTGTFRDMVVTHLLHVLGFVAMERRSGSPPSHCATRPERCSKRSSPWTRLARSSASRTATDASPAWRLTRRSRRWPRSR